MSTLFDADSPSNLTEYTVSELSGSIKRTVETAFDQVRLRGEISGYRGPHSSGHAYFSLKDDKARIDAVVWKASFARLKIKPEEGMEVIATGRVTTFPGSSKYQIVIETLEPAGAGALMALIEERKRRLGAEGLFDQDRKRALPFMPKVIGVITSPTGAVIRDILHRIADRFPVHVVVWPVRVQGEGCGDEVAAAIRGFNALRGDDAIARPDVLIVARGGGSLEDLWGFNDEAVVRAAAESVIPLISAVGHETDWTLIDLAADRRAPTPTGAAEMAVPVKADLEAQAAVLGARLSAAALRQMDARRQAVRALGRALPVLDQLLALPRRRFDEAAASLGRMLEILAMNKRRLFEHSAARLRPDVLTARLSDRRRHVGDLSVRAERMLERRLDLWRRPLLKAETVLSGLPQRLLLAIARDRDKVLRLQRDADRAIAQDMTQKRQMLGTAWRMMDSLSYARVLERGFAVVRGPDGKPLTRAAALSPGLSLNLEFADGRASAIAGGDGPVHPDGAATSAAPRRKAAKGEVPGGNQGSLF